MIDIFAVCKSMEDEINEVAEWSNKLYEKHFGDFFKIQYHLYKRMSDKNTPITDEELETVLTELPLELIQVCEALANFQVGQEVIKIKKKESARDKTTDEWLENELIANLYADVAERVERQVSFSRELIMSCKKIWDRRKDTDIVNPIGPIDDSLPEYTPPELPNTYIK